MFSTLPSRIKQAAREAGFDLCGVTPVAHFRELEAFPRWIADARHGEMKYMEAHDQAGELKRGSLSRVAPWARSVVVCAINYNTSQPYSTQVNDPTRGWISRYAWSREDYHQVVMRRLREVEVKLHDMFSHEKLGHDMLGHDMSAHDMSAHEMSAHEMSGSSVHRPPATDHRLQTRAYVDTGPIIERVYAKYAGVGWIGKNTCVINQQLGSWLFLGVILTSLELEPDLPAPDRCGTCTRCIAACPTQAITAPGELDARLCISYLTIEKRGTIPENLREGIGRHVFGCDICQDVCPWNRKAPASNIEEFQPREGFFNPALDWLAEMEAEEFQTTFRRSPIRRAKLSGLRRNAVIAMANSGDEKFVPALERLATDADAIVREHARWALDRLRASKPA